MTKSQYILAGVALLAASAAFADPSVELRGTSAKSGGKGDIAVIVHGNGTPITAVTIQIPAASGITFNGGSSTEVVGANGFGDLTKVDAGASANAFTLLWGYPSGAAAPSGDVLVATIKGTAAAGGVGSLAVAADPYDPNTGLGSYVNDDQFQSLSVNPTTQVVRGGPGRYIGRELANSPANLAAGRDGTGAFIAGTSGGNMYIMKATDLSDQAAPVAIGGATAGKPAFGTRGSLVVGAGDEAGNVKIVKASDGSAVDSFTVGGPVNNAPAITATDTYVAVNGGLAHKGAGAAEPAAGTGGNSLSSPAVYNGRAVIGTDTAVKTFAVDSGNGAVTPLVAAAAPSGNFVTSPVIIPGLAGAALVADNTGKVYKVDLTTGNGLGSVALGTPVTSGFRSNSTGQTAFGGGDGKVYFVSDAPSQSAATQLGAGQLTVPVTIGTSTYAADSAGKFGRVGGGTDSVQMSGPGTGATVATGTTAGTDIVASSTASGGVVSIPVQ